MPLVAVEGWDREQVGQEEPGNVPADEYYPGVFLSKHVNDIAGPWNTFLVLIHVVVFVLPYLLGRNNEIDDEVKEGPDEVSSDGEAKHLLEFKSRIQVEESPLTLGQGRLVWHGGPSQVPKRDVWNYVQSK